MRAAVFERAGSPLVCVSVPDPAPAKNDLVIKVAYSGVCGTDLHLTQPGIVSSLPPGMVLGHEFSGEVVEAGSDAASQWLPGDRVTVMPYRACPVCGALCKDGLDIICPSVTYLGIAAPGGNAEYVAVNAAQTIRLPDGVDTQAGALVEPLAVGLHAVAKAGSLLGQNVLVIGGGPVGLAVAAFARLGGAARVIVSEPHAVRRGRAEGFAGAETIDPSAADLAEAFQGRAGAKPDVVFECVGIPGMIEEAVKQVKLFGRVVVVGACMEQDRLHPMMAMVKEVTMNFALGHTRADFRFVIDCLARGAIAPHGLVTGIADFATFPAAFERLRSAKDGCKLLLKPN